MKYRVFFSYLIMHVLLSTFPTYSTALSPEPGTIDAVKLDAEKGGYRLINIDELWSLYQKNDPNLLLVDTRQKWEYRSGYIKDAVLFSMEPTWLARMTRRGALEQLRGPDKKKVFVFY
jgi:hypothetical protein